MTSARKIGSLHGINPNPCSNLNSMKTNKNRIITYLRFSAGCAFFAAAAALAFVATTTNVLQAHDVASGKDSALSKSTVRDAVSDAGFEMNPVDGSTGTPLTLALEEAAKRAYPADETPFTAQVNGIIDFKRFMASSASNATPTPGGKGKLSKKNKKQPPEAPRFNTWHPTGPILATEPSILTFTGSQTFVSGRVTALSMDTANGCTAAFCRMWLGAAGGGVWRTTNALASVPSWTFLTQLNFSTNAIGSLFADNNHLVAGVPTLWAGTGEPNASADSEAGLGLFKSTNGGDLWQQVPAQIGPITTISPGTGPNGTYQGTAFFGRSISKIVVDPTNANIIYVASARGVRGVDESYGGPTSNPPVPRPPFGVFKSTDGGVTFAFIFDGDPSCGPGTCLGGGAQSSIRGFHDLALDPSNHTIVYAADFPGAGGVGGGVYRSTDSGATWFQIKTALNSADNVDRCSFSVNTLLPSGNTRMYVGCGNDGANTAQVYRSDLVQTGVPSFTNLTALEVVPSTSGYCTGQCWYDNVIYSPPGFPDVIYVGGSYTYAECSHGSDCRGLVYATDAGSTGFFWSDATWDAQNNGPNPGSCCNANPVTPNGMHPDHHYVITHPTNPFLFWDGSDGGIVRSNGTLSDISSQCASRTYPPGSGTAGQCALLLGTGCPGLFPCGVPTLLTPLNFGLNTLQFQSFGVAGNNALHLMGGTQDNGTWDTTNNFFWNQVIYGDGGQSGFDQGNSNLRFNTFFFQQHDANFQNGNPSKWVVISGQIFNDGVLSTFYPPMISDPLPMPTIFEGTRHVWRTQDWGGSQAFLETNCPEFTTSSSNPACGDFIPLGGPAGTNTAGDLGGLVYGGDRRPTSGSRLVEAIARTTSNTNVAWASTVGGRVFNTLNVDANPGTVPPGFAGSVVWNRLDADTAASKDPTRVPTGIAIDPANPNFHAWVCYSGYNFNTPNQPGHVFDVSWTGAGPATWTDISGNLPDIPYTSIVQDPVTGDLYVSNDFNVFRLKFGQTVWDVAGIGMPLVEVPHLTIVPNARLLYAATHGLGGWFMPLY